MSVYQDVQNAFTQSIIDLALGLPLSLENVDFDTQKDGGEQFLDLTMIPDQQESLDKTLFDELTGIYQVSVYIKSGKGIGTINDTASTLTNHFKHNLNIISGGQCVVIVNSVRNTGRNLDGWFVVDVSITFKTDILR